MDPPGPSGSCLVCAAEEAPSPGWLVGWCRVFDAGKLRLWRLQADGLDQGKDNELLHSLRAPWEP